MGAKSVLLRYLGISIAVLLLVTGCERGAVREDEGEGDGEGPIKVALVTDISGATALFGEGNVRGVRIAIDELNEEGGVLGREVQLLIRDSDSTPELGVQLTRQAILQEDVKAVFGPVSSAVALAMTSVAERYKVPIFWHTSNTITLTTDAFHEYAFQLAANTHMQGRANAIDVADKGFKRWVVIAPDYEYGHTQTQAFIDQLKKLDPDVEIVRRIFPPLGETDFTPFLTTAAAANPDAVYASQFAGDLITLTEQAKGLGLFDDAYFMSYYDTSVLQSMGQDAPEGVTAFSPAPFFALDNPQAERFISTYRERHDEYPPDFAINPYDAVKLWAAGVEEAGSIEPDAVVDALEGYTLDSLRGPLTIREEDHQASAPWFLGEIEFGSEFDFPIWGNIRSVSGRDIW